MNRFHPIPLLAALAALALTLPARAQFAAPEAGSAAPALGDARTQKYRVGLMVTAEGGACRDIYATLPVPADWPEQKVQILQEDVSPDVRGLRYRTLPGGVKQMIVDIPSLSAGDKAHAIVTFSLERASITPPANPPITATPASLRSTTSAVIVCSAKAEPTTRRLILRLADDSAKAMARMATTPARLGRMDVILSFTAANCPSIA
jgi:hypothetical protein